MKTFKLTPKGEATVMALPDRELAKQIKGWTQSKCRRWNIRQNAAIRAGKESK